MISKPEALLAINSFCEGAMSAQPTLKRPNKELLYQQAERAYDLAKLLNKQTTAILADPTGTGKTAMALGAAHCLLRGGIIDAIVVVAPNLQTRERWEERSAWTGFPDQYVIPTKRRSGTEIYRHGRVTFTTSSLVRKPKFPTAKSSSISPERVLFIIDEAHRGFGTRGSQSFTALAEIADGARVLAVTATPVQMNSDDLTTLLEINSRIPEEHKAAVRDFAQKVTRVLEDPDAKLPIELPAAMSQANAVLDKFMLPPNPTKIPKPKFNPTTVVLDAEELRVHHVLRMLAGLVNGGGGDRYYQAIVSSWSAVQHSAVWKELEKRANSDPPTRELLDQLCEHFDTQPHPQVHNTVEWVQKKTRDEARNVLIFTWSTKTQPELARILRERLGEEVDILEPKTTPSSQDIKRFRKKPPPKSPSLILVARNNLSESIDLDGGRPCLVHHDLDWNPVRMKQRWGRVVRISSGFAKIPAEDVYIPSLDLPGPRRLADSLNKRMKFTDALERRDTKALNRLIG